MCVISVSAKERTTPEMVAKMFQANHHGAGIAWREEGHVVWKKGLDLEEVTELCNQVPLPYVVHFRIPSVGGPSLFLTHPFPIQKDVPLELEGKTKTPVMFHNGHWNAWKTTMLDASIRGNGKIPLGKWSDSRAMAWMAAHYGVGMLEFIDEKAVVFGPTELELFGNFGWSKVGEGIWVSNKGWENERVAGFDRAPFYGNRPRGDKSSDNAQPELDKEGHTPGTTQVAGGGVKMATNGSGNQSTALIRRGSGDTSPEKRGGKRGSGGNPDAHPFDSYMTAVRLWRAGDISHKSFKRARRTYESWCRTRKCQALPRPNKTGDLMVM